MKKQIWILILILGVFGCQKDEVMMIPERSDIMQQLRMVAQPSNQEIVSLIENGNSKKSGEIIMIQVFKMSESSWIVTENYCIKTFAYYKTTSRGGGERLELFLICQQFEVFDGKINPSQYALSYSILFNGKNQSRTFRIVFDAKCYSINVQCTITDNKGKKIGFSYPFHGDMDTIILPNLEGAEWRVSVKAFDGDMWRSLTTGVIDMNQPSNLLFWEYNILPTNIVCYVNISADMITDGGFYVYGQSKETGEDFSVYVSWIGGTGKILFPLSFFPEKVQFQNGRELSRFLVVAPKDDWPTYTPY